MRRVSLILLLFCALVWLNPSLGRAEVKPVAPPEVKFWLTILHNSHGESELINLGTGFEDFGGIARFATVVSNLRAQATVGPPAGFPPGSSTEIQPPGKRGVILINGGDNFLAGPEWNASLQAGVPYYDAVALDLMGYDAMGLGNHEFDFGPEVLANFIESFLAPVPFVSANLDVSQETRLDALFEEGLIARSVIVRERGESIGIVSAITPSLSFVSSPRNVIVDPDVVATVQDEIDHLQSKGIDKIVLISHLQDVPEDQMLASQLSGVDVMVAGGSDELLANSGDLLIPDGTFVFGPYPLIATDAGGNEIPVVTTAGRYGYVGRLLVGFDKEGNVVEASGGPVRVAGGDHPDAVDPDPVIQSLVVDPVEAAIAALPTNILATSEVDLDGLRANIRSMETNEGNLTTDSLRWQAEQLAASYGVPQPDVALLNGGGIRNDSIFPAGDVSELNTFEMLPFSNFVTVLPDIPRDQFKEILENAVSRTQPGDEPGGSGRFAQISGFSFVWSGSGTAQKLDFDGNVLVPGTRVQDVVLDDGTVVVSGGAVVAGPGIDIATVDFLARGGDQYPFRGASFTMLGVTYQQALSNYLVDALGGSIASSDYPEGGEGRNTELP